MKTKTGKRRCISKTGAGVRCSKPAWQDEDICLVHIAVREDHIHGAGCCGAMTAKGTLCSNTAPCRDDPDGGIFCGVHDPSSSKAGTTLLGGPGDGYRVYNATPGERFLVHWHGDHYVYDWQGDALVFANIREPGATAFEDIERGLAQLLQMIG